MAGELTHLDEHGAARMVDVSAKDITVREATARCRVAVGEHVVDLLRGGDLPKGDALALARFAAITATKRTADLIPLCHPLALHGVDVDVSVGDAEVIVTVTARTADRTGVEMEALTGAAVAGLTIIDMVKGVDRSAAITEVVLLAKSGGRSGDWVRQP